MTRTIIGLNRANTMRDTLVAPYATSTSASTSSPSPAYLKKPGGSDKPSEKGNPTPASPKSGNTEDLLEALESSSSSSSDDENGILSLFSFSIPFLFPFLTLSFLFGSYSLLLGKPRHEIVTELQVKPTSENFKQKLNMQLTMQVLLLLLRFLPLLLLSLSMLSFGFVGRTDGGATKEDWQGHEDGHDDGPFL